MMEYTPRDTEPEQTPSEAFKDVSVRAWTCFVAFTQWVYSESAPFVGAAATHACAYSKRAIRAIKTSAKTGYINDAVRGAKRAARVAITEVSHWAFAPKPRGTGFNLASATIYTSNGLSVDVTDAVLDIIEDDAYGDRWEEYMTGRIPEGVERGDWRLEARYTVDGRKYRVIVPPGIENFPRLNIPVRRSFPRVSSAALISESGKRSDITARVLKYMGPRGDWHGSPDGVKIADMFPNDDSDQLLRAGYKVAVTGHCLKTEITDFDEESRIKLP